MKPLLILTLLLIPLAQAQEPAANGDESPLVVLSSKWARDRQPGENAVSVSAAGSTPTGDNQGKQKL